MVRDLSASGIDSVAGGNAVNNNTVAALDISRLCIFTPMVVDYAGLVSNAPLPLLVCVRLRLYIDLIGKYIGHIDGRMELFDRIKKEIDKIF